MIVLLPADFDLIKEQIRDRLTADMVLDYCGATGQVHRGNEIRCCCPIHNGDGRNFSWDLINNVWTCWSRHCGESSSMPRDEFSLVQLCKNISFYESVKELGSLVGIDIGSSEFEYDKDEHDKLMVQRWLRRRKKATNQTEISILDEEILQSFSKVKHPYLLQRGISDLLIDEFEICYATAGEFKGRIVVPIRDENGNLVGFSGRLPTDDPKVLATTPKYKHMMDFTKGAVLYGLDKAKHFIDSAEFPVPKSLVLCEGFFDVINAWGCGGFNIVATMGTSLSSTQLELVVRHTSTVVLAYDTDEAGRLARSKIYKQLKPFCDVYFLQLPEGRDLGDLTLDEFWAVYSNPIHPINKWTERRSG